MDHAAPSTRGGVRPRTWVVTRTDQPVADRPLAEQVGLAVAAREREARGAERREVVTEVVAAAAFALAAGAFWISAGAPSPGVSGRRLTLLVRRLRPRRVRRRRGQHAAGRAGGRADALLLPPGVVPLPAGRGAPVAGRPISCAGGMDAAAGVAAVRGRVVRARARAGVRLAPDPSARARRRCSCSRRVLARHRPRDLGAAHEGRARHRPARRSCAGSPGSTWSTRASRRSACSPRWRARRTRRCCRAAAARRPAGDLRARAARPDRERAGAPARREGQPRAAADDRAATRRTAS